MPFEGQPIHLTDTQHDDLEEIARSNAFARRVRPARQDRPFDKFRCVCEASVLLANEDVQRGLRGPFPGRTDVILQVLSRDDAVPPVSVEIGDGVHGIEWAGAGLCDDTKKGRGPGADGSREIADRGQPRLDGGGVRDAQTAAFQLQSAYFLAAFFLRSAQ